jgi:hypothetical protein
MAALQTTPCFAVKCDLDVGSMIASFDERYEVLDQFDCGYSGAYIFRCFSIEDVPSYVIVDNYAGVLITLNLDGGHRHTMLLRPIHVMDICHDMTKQLFMLATPMEPKIRIFDEQSLSKGCLKNIQFIGDFISSVPKIRVICNGVHAVFASDNALSFDLCKTWHSPGFTGMHSIAFHPSPSSNFVVVVGTYLQDVLFIRYEDDNPPRIERHVVMPFFFSSLDVNPTNGDICFCRMGASLLSFWDGNEEFKTKDIFCHCPQVVSFFPLKKK